MSWIVCCTGSVINDLVAITRAIADVKIVVLISLSSVIVTAISCHPLGMIFVSVKQCLGQSVDRVAEKVTNIGAIGISRRCQFRLSACIPSLISICIWTPCLKITTPLAI
jgi:hypothetical protein